MKKLILIALLFIVVSGYIVSMKAFGTIAKLPHDNDIAQIESMSK